MHATDPQSLVVCKTTPERTRLKSVYRVILPPNSTNNANTCDTEHAVNYRVRTEHCQQRVDIAFKLGTTVT